MFGDGVTDVYFRVGHSHNTSDMKTAHANKAMSKKNLYTPHMVVEEINKMKGLTGRLFDDRDGMFFDWKSFLDKHFPNMDPGFTSYFLFEFKDGVVKYKEVDGDGKIVTVKTKVFCANPAATRKIILQELLNLSPTSNVFEILKTKPRLPPLPVRRVSRKKIDNMKILYQQIPRCHRWFYPEGCDVVDDPHTELRRRAVEINRVPVLPNDEVIGDPLLQAQDNDASDEPIATASDEPIALQERRQGSNNKDNSRPKRKVGRPPKVKPIERNQPAIHRFLTTTRVPDAAALDNVEPVVVELGEDSDDSFSFSPIKKKSRREEVNESISSEEEEIEEVSRSFHDDDINSEEFDEDDYEYELPDGV